MLEAKTDDPQFLKDRFVGQLLVAQEAVIGIDTNLRDGLVAGRAMRYLEISKRSARIFSTRHPLKLVRKFSTVTAKIVKPLSGRLCLALQFFELRQHRSSLLAQHGSPHAWLWR